jgi:hypothetical protein
MEEKVFVFWHLCGMNDWRSIAEDQYRTMESSGLLERVEQVNLTFLGTDRNEVAWLEAKSKKINVNKYGSDLKQYERTCLNGLKDWSEENDGIVLYLHGKGVSRTNIKNNVWAWRKMLEYFIMENHDRCIKEMKNLDALGGNACLVGRKINDLRPGHGMHYSGNFWWSRASYIRTLPRLREDIRLDINGNYIRQCEYWILSNFPNMRCGVAFKTNQSHYYKSLPEKDFRNKWL